MAKQDPWLKNYPKGIAHSAAFDPVPLYSILDQSVARFPNQPLIDFLGRTFTFADIGRLVDRAAKGFQGLGVKKGIKVGLFLPNCPQFVVAYYGVLKAGGTVVNFSPLYAEPELLHQIEDSHTDIMVTLNLKVLYPKMEAMLEQSRVKTLVVGTMSEVLPFPKNLLFPLARSKDIVSVPDDGAHISFKELTKNDGAYKPVKVNPSKDVAVLQYTGGTTGVSKGAMLTHANLTANTEQARMWFVGLKEGEERVMGVLPFFHVFAMTVVMNMSIRLGAEIVMHPRFELEPVMKDIAKKKPTVKPGLAAKAKKAKAVPAKDEPAKPAPRKAEAKAPAKTAKAKPAAKKTEAKTPPKKADTRPSAKKGKAKKGEAKKTARPAAKKAPAEKAETKRSARAKQPSVKAAPVKPATRKPAGRGKK